MNVRKRTKKIEAIVVFTNNLFMWIYRYIYCIAFTQAKPEKESAYNFELVFQGFWFVEAERWKLGFVSDGILFQIQKNYFTTKRSYKKN